MNLIDWDYVRSTERRIADLWYSAGQTKLRIIRAFDNANDTEEMTKIAAPVSADTAQKREDTAKQIKSLEAEEDRRVAERQRLEKELREHLSRVCFAFCETLRTRLPRELCILIFEALWAGTMHVLTDWNMKDLETKPDDPMAVVQSWSDVEMLYCLEKRFVGDFCSESRKAWWRNSTFEIKSSAMIHLLLSENFWGESVRDKIRYAVLRMQYGEYRDYHSMNPPIEGVFRTSVSTSGKRGNIDAELALLSHFDQTTVIQLWITGTKLHITGTDIWIAKRLGVPSPSQVDQRVLRRGHILQAIANHIFPRLKLLHREGYRIWLVLDGNVVLDTSEVALEKVAWEQALDAALKALDREDFKIAEREHINRCWPPLIRA